MSDQFDPRVLEIEPRGNLAISNCASDPRKSKKGMRLGLIASVNWKSSEGKNDDCEFNLPMKTFLIQGRFLLQTS